MSIRFLVLSADYPAFLRWLYAQNPGLERRAYEEQMRVRMDSLFGVADFHTTNLRKLGHEAINININNEILQKQWAKENSLKVATVSNTGRRFADAVRALRGAAGNTPLRHVRPLLRPLLRKLDNGHDGWLYEILAAQIKAYHPDVLYSLSLKTIDSNFLRRVRDYYRLAVGQHASPLPDRDIGEYDLILSSLPNQVEYFRRQGVPSEYLRLGFEPKVLKRLEERDKRFGAVFVGGVGTIHEQGTLMLETLCRQCDIRVWGYGQERLSEDSPVRKNYMGNAWGVEMYQTLRDARIAFNRHIGAAANFANNMRLYEATGVGTMLLTDYKDNLSDLFEPGREVIAYHNVEECIELIRYYLEHDKEREEIARAGQQRTLQDHTFYQRMQEMAAIVSQYL
jgi:hypothetical protein